MTYKTNISIPTSTVYTVHTEHKFPQLPDVCVYRFIDLSWGMDFIPDQCLFDYVEIIANASPDKLASAMCQEIEVLAAEY